MPSTVVLPLLFTMAVAVNPRAGAAVADGIVTVVIDNRLVAVDLNANRIRIRNGHAAFVVHRCAVAGDINPVTATAHIQLAVPFTTALLPAISVPVEPRPSTVVLPLLLAVASSPVMRVPVPPSRIVLSPSLLTMALSPFISVPVESFAVNGGVAVIVHGGFVAVNLRAGAAVADVVVTVVIDNRLVAVYLNTDGVRSVTVMPPLLSTVALSPVISIP